MDSRAAGTWQLGQDSLDGIARTGQPRLDRTNGTGQPREYKMDRLAVKGHSGETVNTVHE